MNFLTRHRNLTGDTNAPHNLPNAVAVGHLARFKQAPLPGDGYKVIFSFPLLRYCDAPVLNKNSLGRLRFKQFSVGSPYDLTA